VNRELRRRDRERQSQLDEQADNSAGLNAGEPDSNGAGLDEDDEDDMDEDYDPNATGQQLDNGDESEEDAGVVSKVVKRVIKKTPQVPKKRKQAELDEGELETTISAGGEGKKRPKLSDLDEVSREYAVYTQKHFRSQLGNVEAFPDGARVIRMFGHAWRQACAHFEEDRPPTKLIKSLVLPRVWQFRGEIVSAARNEIPTAYNFKTHCAGLSIRDAKAKRGELIDDLLDDHRFIYKNPDDDINKGSYQHDIFQDVLNKSLFRCKQSDGICFRNFYCDPESGISPNLLALIATAVECALDEWQDGERKMIDFSAKVYQSRYKRHCATLQRMIVGGPAVGKICVRMAKAALHYAGVSRQAESSNTAVMNADQLHSAANEDVPDFDMD